MRGNGGVKAGLVISVGKGKGRGEDQNGEIRNGDRGQGRRKKGL